MTPCETAALCRWILNLYLSVDTDIDTVFSSVFYTFVSLLRYTSTDIFKDRYPGK